MPYGSQEAAVIRTYLDTVLDLPWNKSSKDKIVISKVQKALDKTHYGLDKVKKRIIEQLAVRVLSEKQKGQIICLAGPPGVGKTSIAQSIAKAIGRKVKESLLAAFVTRLKSEVTERLISVRCRVELLMHCNMPALIILYLFLDEIENLR